MQKRKTYLIILDPKCSEEAIDFTICFFVYNFFGQKELINIIM